MAHDHEKITYGMNEVKELFDASVLTGTIVSVDTDNDKAHVNISGFGQINDVPIFYHCEGKNDTEGGATAFEEGDSVYVLNKKGRTSPGASDLQIVGFVGGLKKCIECDCTDILIGYVTQNMSVSEEQTLSVIGAIEGCTYSWEITSGAGTLSADTGTSVVYTAPDSNENCNGNPTIKLSVEDESCDTLEIAINGGLGNAYIMNFQNCESSETECGGECDCGCYCYEWDIYRCDGSFHLHHEPDSLYYYCGCTGICAGDPPWCDEGGPCVPGACWGPYNSGSILDIRSPAQKAAGCCPAALL